VILGLGKIMQPYSSIEKHACYGFGGTSEEDNQPSSCFILNGEDNSPFLNSFQEVH
jgi:hypothetical protein